MTRSILALLLCMVMSASLGGRSDASLPPWEPVIIDVDLGAVLIRNHRGGFLPEIVRVREEIRRKGLPVRIDGAYCFSSCTVFLALPDLCVSPSTAFGFHAPVRPDGLEMSREEFEAATGYVARQFSPELSSWWLTKGRHTRNGLAILSGLRLSEMGYRLCEVEKA